MVEEIIELQGQGSNTNGNTVIRSIPVNLSSNERIGAELGLLYNPAKWLRLNGSFNFFQFNTEGFFNDVDYSAKNTSYFARFSSKVSLPWSIDWQTNAFYRGAAQNAQSDTDGILSVDMALSKDLFDEKFCKMWEFYLASCAAAFRYRDLVVFQLQIVKNFHSAHRTRDYIYS